MPHIHTGTRTIPTLHIADQGSVASCHIYVQGPYLNAPVGWWAGFMPYIRTGTRTIPTPYTLHLLAGGLVSCHIYVQGLGPYLLHTLLTKALSLHATYTYRD